MVPGLVVEFFGSECQDKLMATTMAATMVAHEGHVDAVGFCRYDAEYTGRPLLSRDVRRVA